MRIRIRTAAGCEHWSLAAAPHATVGSLATAVGLPRAAYYALGGVVTAAERPLGEVAVLPGMLLESISPAPQEAAVTIVVVDGPDAGRQALLAPGKHLLGRHPCSVVTLTDPGISAAHLEVVVATNGSVTLIDRSFDGATFLGSRRLTHRTTLGQRGEVRIGATTVRIALVEHSVSPPVEMQARRQTPRHRSPRVPTAIDLDIPVQPTNPTNPPAVMASFRNLITMVVPTTAGALLALALRPELAMFAMLGPIGAIVTWLILRVTDARSQATHAGTQAERTHRHAQALDRHRDDCERARRSAYPDMGELAGRIRSLDSLLWQRRKSHSDFGHLSIGIGDLIGSPSQRELGDVPIAIDATKSVGIVGQPARTAALARSLALQLAALHGPADLHVAVFTNSPEHWQWAQWLPHCTASDGTDLIATTDDGVQAACHFLANSDQPAAATTVVLVDARPLPPQWRHALNQLLISETVRASVVMCATAETLLLEQCSTVVTLHDRGGAHLHSSTTAAPIATVGVVNQLRVDVADDLAAHLAPLRDGARPVGAVPLADRASLLDLLAITVCDDDNASHAGAVDAIDRRWADHKRNAKLRIPIGVGDDGPLHLDLIDDGPHGLMAGTTGSGKSELLRTIVLSLAATADPEHVAMLLVDYKGGSAFDGVSALPHVVEVLTDLDPATASRAVRGLQAEVRHREQLLRGCEAGDIVAYHDKRRSNPALAPLPRLVIVVDEFATLAAELPEFVDSLVDVAQRGRSLGVHLLLATQRPSGAVKDSIRTNTNLRIALRVLDGADSRDVLGVDDAARLSRRVRGRGLVRLGAGDIRRFQSAYVAMSTPPRPQGHALVIERVHPVGATRPDVESHAPRPSDLDRLVSAIADAHDRLGTATAQRPWADPLPTTLGMDDLGRWPTDTFVLGLSDQPDCRGHAPLLWHPQHGNVLFAGLAGCGTTTALANVIAQAVAATLQPPAWVYVIAAAVAPYVALAERPDLGAVVAVDDRERLDRLVRRLEHEVHQRRQSGQDAAPSRPQVIVAIDGVGALRSSLDSLSGIELLDTVERIAVEGPAVGVHLAFATEHPASLGHRLERTLGMTVLLDAEQGSAPPGRGTCREAGLAVQLVHVDALDFASTIAESTTSSTAPTIGRLPDHLHRSQLPPPALLDDRLAMWVGIGENPLAPAGFLLRPDDQVLICGPPRSGKSTMIDDLYRAFVEAGIEPVLIASARRRSGDAITSTEAIADALASAAQHHRLARERGDTSVFVVLIDDADAIEERGAIEQLVTGGLGQVIVVAAARGDRLRGLFRHWTNELRRSGQAVLLRPDEADADLLGVRLPRSFAKQVPGRGWIVNDGVVQRCQFPTPPVTSGANE